MISEEYSLEYGTDKIEMHVGAVEPGERAIIIDDLIATGGTLAAAIRLLGKLQPTLFLTNASILLIINKNKLFIFCGCRASRSDDC